MKIHKTGTDEDGVRFRNELLQDQRITFAARGLLMQLLIKPDGWQGTADDIARERREIRGSSKKGEGREAVRALFTELEHAGYLVRRRVRNAQGLLETVIEVYDRPQPGSSETTTDRPPRPRCERGEYLYRHWDPDGRLLYVGVASRPAARQRRHEASSSWMVFQAEMTVEPFPSRAEAEAAESEAIRAEQPLFNVAGNESPEAQQRLVDYLIEHGRTDLLSPAVSRG